MMRWQVGDGQDLADFLRGVTVLGLIAIVPNASTGNADGSGLQA